VYVEPSTGHRKFEMTVPPPGEHVAAINTSAAKGRTKNHARKEEFARGMQEA
jgi:hypothetical protein